HERDRVELALAAAHDLTGLDRVNGVDLIAQPCSTLEMQSGGGTFHALCQLLNQLATATLQYFDRILHVLSILLLGDQVHAGSGATLNLVLQTGARAICEVLILAWPETKDLLQ